MVFSAFLLIHIFPKVRYFAHTLTLILFLTVRLSLFGPHYGSNLDTISDIDIHSEHSNMELWNYGLK